MGGRNYNSYSLTNLPHTHRYAQFAGFELWKAQIEKWKMAEKYGAMSEAAVVVQRFIKNRQAEQRSMKHMKAVVELALHNRKMINMVLAFEKLAPQLTAHHQTNKAIKHKEDHAASVIRRNWNAHMSRGGVMSLIMSTRARKKKAQEELEERMAVRLQHNWRARNDRMGLMLFREARRKRLEAERQARELAAEEAKLGLAVKTRRNDAADIIRKAYEIGSFWKPWNRPP